MDMTAFLRQIAVLLAIILLGYIAAKRKTLSGADAAVFTRLVSNVTLPFTLFSAVNAPLTAQQRQSAPFVFLLFAGAYIVTLLLGRLLTKAGHMPEGRSVILINGATFPNAVFVGLPLLEGLFGSSIYLYVGVSTLAFSVIFFTYSVSVMQPGRGLRWRDFVTPCNAAVVLMLIALVFQITLPPTASKIVSGIGAVSTPLSLIVIGILLADSDLKAVLCNRFLYLACLLRNVLLPLLMLGLLLLLRMNTEDGLIILILYACPCATLISVYAKAYELEAKLAGEMVLLSTILSAVTLPLIAWLGQAVL